MGGSRSHAIPPRGSTGVAGGTRPKDESKDAYKTQGRGLAPGGGLGLGCTPASLLRIAGADPQWLPAILRSLQAPRWCPRLGKPPPEAFPTLGLAAPSVPVMVSWWAWLVGVAKAEFTAMREQYMRGGEGFIVCYSVTDRQSFQEAAKFKELIFQVRHTYEIPLVLVGNKIDLEQFRQGWQACHVPASRVPQSPQPPSTPGPTEGTGKPQMVAAQLPKAARASGVLKLRPAGHMRPAEDIYPARWVSTEEGLGLAREYNCAFFETSAALRFCIDDAFHGLVREIRKKESVPSLTGKKLKRKDSLWKKGGGNDPTSPQCSRSTSPWYDANTPYGVPAMMPMMGPPPPGMMPGHGFIRTQGHVASPGPRGCMASPGPRCARFHPDPGPSLTRIQGHTASPGPGIQLHPDPGARGLTRARDPASPGSRGTWPHLDLGSSFTGTQGSMASPGPRGVWPHPDPGARGLSQTQGRVASPGPRCVRPHPDAGPSLTRIQGHTASPGPGIQLHLDPGACGLTRTQGHMASPGPRTQPHPDPGAHDLTRTRDLASPGPRGTSPGINMKTEIIPISEGRRSPAHKADTSRRLVRTRRPSHLEKQSCLRYGTGLLTQTRTLQPPDTENCYHSFRPTNNKNPDFPADFRESKSLPPSPQAGARLAP
ncbi:hypothetical protein QTO34_002397 [Cnephaeus nilssonii]|uniref:Uncharacterized protein n=1 Tax=Cnephaeus nilssonii TaxID=3371016 RepID=A0AA40HUY7_CNENI|nr:hypothetical protein QTO34_002397 [Eptesicus nilssonii]